MLALTHSTSVQKLPVTVEQWGELDGEIRCDLVNGYLEERPDVAFWHEILLTHLLASLYKYVTKFDLGVLVSSKAKLKISKFVGREPDIFFIPKTLTHLVGKNLFKGVPSLVIEIISPETEQVDRREKFREYARLGIGQYWIVDFPRRRIEVFTLERAGRTRKYRLRETATGNALFRPAIFPGLRIPLSKLWPTEYEDRTDE